MIYVNADVCIKWCAIREGQKFSVLLRHFIFPPCLCVSSNSNSVSAKSPCVLPNVLVNDQTVGLLQGTVAWNSGGWNRQGPHLGQVGEWKNATPGVLSKPASPAGFFRRPDDSSCPCFPHRVMKRDVLLNCNFFFSTVALKWIGWSYFRNQPLWAESARS